MPNGVLVIKCHQCSRAAGRSVFHRWDTTTTPWTFLDRETFRPHQRGGG